MLITPWELLTHPWTRCAWSAAEGGDLRDPRATDHSQGSVTHWAPQGPITRRGPGHPAQASRSLSARALQPHSSNSSQTLGELGAPPGSPRTHRSPLLHPPQTQARQQGSSPKVTATTRPVHAACPGPREWHRVSLGPDTPPATTHAQRPAGRDRGRGTGCHTVRVPGDLRACRLRGSGSHPAACVPSTAGAK